MSADVCRLPAGAVGDERSQDIGIGLKLQMPEAGIGA